MNNDQAKRLRERLLSEEPQINAIVVSIVSGKGGVGKSNFTVNFAIDLARRNKKVLIFDLDIGMGNIDILLGRQSTHHINHLFEDRYSIEQIIERGPENIDYIAGGNALNDFFHLDEKKRTYFFNEFESILTKYDYVLFDMGAGATEESLSFILASDKCIVITTPEPTSITDAYAMIKHIFNKSNHMSINIVMNRSKSPKSGYKALKGIKEVTRNFLNASVEELGVLPEDSTVNEAVMRQIPYVLLKSNAKVSKALTRIVNNFLREAHVTEEERRNVPSFIRRLRQLIRGN